MISSSFREAQVPEGLETHSGEVDPRIDNRGQGAGLQTGFPLPDEIVGAHDGPVPADLEAVAAILDGESHVEFLGSLRGCGRGKAILDLPVRVPFTDPAEARVAASASTWQGTCSHSPGPCRQRLAIPQVSLSPGRDARCTCGTDRSVFTVK